MDAIDTALSIGEIVWALRCAKADVTAAKKKGAPAHLAALRRLARIESAHDDDEDLPSLARAAKAWAKVTEAKGATDEDHEQLAWAELLAGRTRKASEAMGKRSFVVLSAALAWAARRKDAKKRAALESIVTSELSKKKDRERNVERLEHAVRLLLQGHAEARELAQLLVAQRSALAVWDPARSRATALLAAAHRVADDGKTADRIAKEWALACEKALPKKDDPRRYVLDHVGKSTASALEKARRRVARALAVYDAKSPALEMPLYALAHAAKEEDAHEVVVDACRRLVPLMAARKGQEDLRERHGVLTDLRQSLTALGRFDEALAVADDADDLKAKMDLHLHPDHYARAEIYEAMGDLDRMVEAHLASVAQHEAGEPPIYGPDASNTDLARGWARDALIRAGRKKEADRRFPKEK